MDGARRLLALESGAFRTMVRRNLVSSLPVITCRRPVNVARRCLDSVVLTLYDTQDYSVGVVSGFTLSHSLETCDLKGFRPRTKSTGGAPRHEEEVVRPLRRNRRQQPLRRCGDCEKGLNAESRSDRRGHASRPVRVLVVSKLILWRRDEGSELREQIAGMVEANAAGTVEILVTDCRTVYTPHIEARQMRLEPRGSIAAIWFRGADVVHIMHLLPVLRHILIGALFRCRGAKIIFSPMAFLTDDFGLKSWTYRRPRLWTRSKSLALSGLRAAWNIVAHAFLCQSDYEVRSSRLPQREVRRGSLAQARRAAPRGRSRADGVAAQRSQGPDCVRQPDGSMAQGHRPVVHLALRIRIRTAPPGGGPARTPRDRRAGAASRTRASGPHRLGLDTPRAPLWSGSFNAAGVRCCSADTTPSLEASGKHCGSACPSSAHPNADSIRSWRGSVRARWSMEIPRRRFKRRSSLSPTRE